MVTLDQLDEYISVEAAKRDGKIVLVGIGNDESIVTVAAFPPNGYETREDFIRDFSAFKGAMLRNPDISCVQVIQAEEKWTKS